MSGTGFEAERPPVVAATISLDEIPEGNVDIMSGAVEIERISHPSGGYAPSAAAGGSEIPGSSSSFGAQPLRETTFDPSAQRASPVSAAPGGTGSWMSSDSEQRRSLPAMFAEVPASASPVAAPRTAPRIGFHSSNAPLGSMMGPPTATYAPTQMAPQGSMAGTLPPMQEMPRRDSEQSRRIQELEAERATAQGELMQQRRASEELVQQLAVTRESQAATRAQVQDQQLRMRELADELQHYQRELLNSQATATNLHRARQDLQQQLIAAQATQDENARLHKSHQDLIAQLESQVSNYRQEQVEHAASQQALAGTLAELQNRNYQAEELDRQLKEARLAEDQHRRQRQQDRFLIEGLQRDLQTTNLSQEHHGAQTAAYNERIRSLDEQLKEARVSEARQADMNQAHAQRVAFLEAERASNEASQTPPPSPSPPIKVKGMPPLRGLELQVMVLGFFMLLGAMVLPVMCSFTVLQDDNYRFWAGFKWPVLVLLGCFSIAVIYVITAKLLLKYAMEQGMSEDTLKLSINTFLLLLGSFLLILAVSSNSSTSTVSGRLSQGCLSSLADSELLVDYSQVLYNIRLIPNCSSKRSVEDCKGWAENRYTHYLRYLESEFQCGPLCTEFYPPARAVVSPSVGAAQRDKDNVRFLQERGGLNRAMGSHAQLKVEEFSSNLDVASLLSLESMATDESSRDLDAPHVQAAKLFSQGRTKMSCYPLVATRLRVLNSMFGGLLFWEGVGLVVASLILKIVTLFTTMSRTHMLKALGFVGKMKKAVKSKLPNTRW